MKLVINIIAFQISWFSCVLGAANGLPWLGLLVTFPVFALYLFLQPNKKLALLGVLFTVVVGSLLDQALFSLGLSHYPANDLTPFLLPSWMYALWLGFATTINVSLKWLRDKVWIAIFFGLVGGPLAYYSASKLGAIQFSEPTLTYTMLSLGWAMLTPFLIRTVNTLTSSEQN